MYPGVSEPERQLTLNAFAETDGLADGRFLLCFRERFVQTFLHQGEGITV